MRPSKTVGRCVILIAVMLVGCQSAEESATLVLAGDTMFGRFVGDEYREHLDPRFGEIAETLAAADFTIVNLETAICEVEVARRASGDLLAQRHRLVAPPSRGRLLREAGVDLAVVANNHALDCGAESLVHTMETLGHYGVATVGAREPSDTAWPASIHHASFGTVVVTAATLHPPPVRAAGLLPSWITPRNEASFVEHVHALREQYPDALLVASLHFGREKKKEPTTAQRALATALVHAGADIIHGHGAHVMQPIERIGHSVVAYGTGNLHFDMREPLGFVELRIHQADGRPRIESVTHHQR